MSGSNLSNRPCSSNRWQPESFRKIWKGRMCSQSTEWRRGKNKTELLALNIIFLRGKMTTGATPTETTSWTHCISKPRQREVVLPTSSPRGTVRSPPCPRWLRLASAFDFRFQVAAPPAYHNSGSFHVVTGGTGCDDYITELSGLVTVPSTGGWGSFASLSM